VSVESIADALVGGGGFAVDAIGVDLGIGGLTAFAALDGQQTRYQPRAGALGCSTNVPATPDRRAIESQSVRLGASFLRPERRSDDGQMILKAP
jgi:hypothetical protein